MNDDFNNMFRETQGTAKKFVALAVVGNMVVVGAVLGTIIYVASMFAN